MSSESSFGLINGISTPYSDDIFAISSSSVETITLSNKKLSKAVFIDQAIIGC